MWPLHARRVKSGACGTQMADLQAHLQDAEMEQLSISHFGCKPERMQAITKALLTLAVAPAPSQHL